jgi:hypothetical protein
LGFVQKSKQNSQWESRISSTSQQSRAWFLHKTSLSTVSGEGCAVSTVCTICHKPGKCSSYVIIETEKSAKAVSKYSAF